MLRVNRTQRTKIEGKSINRPNQKVSSTTTTAGKLMERKTMDTVIDNHTSMILPRRTAWGTYSGYSQSEMNVEVVLPRSKLNAAMTCY